MCVVFDFKQKFLSKGFREGGNAYCGKQGMLWFGAAAYIQHNTGCGDTTYGNTEEGCNVTHTFENDDAVQEEHIRKGKEMHSDDMTDEEVLLDDENEDMMDDENEDMMDDENEDMMDDENEDMMDDENEEEMNDGNKENKDICATRSDAEDTGN